MKHIWKAAAIVVAALTIASCNDKKFTVEGQVANAKDSVLYFENVGLEGINTLDSIKLDEGGSFSFSEEAPATPEFYRLRIADQIINVSIDSTETVQFKAEYPGMASNYTVSGSDNCEKIKELTLMQMELQNRAIAIQRNPSLGVDEANDSIQRLINAHKEKVKSNYIYKEPMKAYSYFALFQAIGNYLIFNPRTNKDDIKAFAAVATSWDNKFPHANRAINLHNIAIRGMKNVRGPVVKEVELDPDKIHETDIINISLPDIKGEIRNLTDLKGKVVLLDFTIYNHTQSAQRNMLLREIYDKYKDQGFEIFQISLDTDEHFWKTNADNLPWVCVRDANGIYSTNVTIYGVSTIPTFFLIDRDNTLNKRNDDIKDVETEIQKLL